ncbi:hypothetical protein ABZ429_29580, partial [Streptomyces albidoflavus]
MNRLLLAAYPASHRARHGDEVLGCLAEAYPGRSWPPPREVAALLGVEQRFRLDQPQPAPLQGRD